MKTKQSRWNSFKPTPYSAKFFLDTLYEDANDFNIILQEPF